MPVQPTYPGVYIEETSSGVRTISGVSTSVAAFIGYFNRGPMNKAVQIFNWGDFERLYGGLNSQSEASYAIQQFFINGGTQACVVRVASGVFRAASVEISDSSSAASRVLNINAIHPGNWGDNIRVRIDPTSAGDTFNMVITEFDNLGQTSLRQEVFRNLTMVNVAKVLNDGSMGSKIIFVTKPGDDPPLVNGTLSGELQDGITISAESEFKVSINNVERTATFSEEVQTEELEKLAARLEDAIRSASPGDPLFAGATVDVVGNQLHILAGPGNPKCIVTFSDKDQTDTTASTLKLTTDAATNLQEYILGGGTIADSAQMAGVTGADGAKPESDALIGKESLKTGMYALDEIDLFNILCIPRLGDDSGTAFDAVLSRALDYCQKRRAFFIVDTPKGINDLPGIKKWKSDKESIIRSNNAALYYPRVKIPDPLDNYRSRSVGASGTIAGLYARTDGSRGIWKAPAGTEAVLRNVSELTDTQTNLENGVLNKLGVNCLRNFPVYGNICWGARTLEGADAMASEWKYIPVRRLALFIEESLYRGSQWVVFEPNDESLWSQIRMNVGSFMHDLFRKGAFQGSNPKQAYLVKCDKETTTQSDINKGRVNILVGFAPLKPAEFVFIQIQQLAGQV